MDVLTAPATLRYIASEGAAQPPPGLRLYVCRKGEKVFLCLNGVSMAVHDNGTHHCLPLRFSKVDLGAFSGRWTSTNTFDIDFVTNTVNAMSVIPVGLSVDVCVHNGFYNELVAIPQLHCQGVFVSRNCIRLLFPPNSSVKATIRNPQFAVHSSHESPAEMRTDLLPRVPFCANKCLISVKVNVEQHKTVSEYLSVLMNDTGIWRQCFKALCVQPQQKLKEQSPQQPEAECLVSL